MRSLALLVLGLLLVGCSDPIVGSWRAESSTSCGVGEDTLDFTVESDLTGEGSVCGCEFSFEAESVTSDVYEVTVDFDAGCLALDGTYECELSSDGNTLDCGSLGEYSRSE